MKHLGRVWWVALIVAWGFDFLFWMKTPGISFAVYTAVCLLGGFVLTYSEGLRPAKASLLLLIPIGFFATTSWLRLEPFTQTLSYFLTLAMLALLSVTYLGGKWLYYGWRDYFLQGALLFFDSLTRPLSALANSRSNSQTSQPADLQAKPSTQKTFGRRAIPVLRGLLLAIPVVGFFGALLAAADPIFSSRVGDIFNLLQIDNLPEYMFRLFYIAILAYILAAVYLHALTVSRDENILTSEGAWPPPFLGLTEGGIVLGSVNLLFGFFVLIQFQYFFGGQINITVDGYTYADYARRGFGELVAVALFSILLFFGLSAITRRAAPLQRRVFSGLGVALTLLVVIILSSAFQRLILYEQAYGFTRLRTYPHVLMIWLGVLLVALMVMELADRLRHFPLATLLAVIGFGVTLNAVNVDGLIVKQNILAAQAGATLDTAYLDGLSADAIPAMVELFNTPGLSANLHDDLGGVLACQKVLNPQSERDPSWQAYHLSRALADQWLAAADLSAYPATQNDGGQWVVTVNKEERFCSTSPADY